MDRERVVQEKDTLVQRYIQILNVKNLTLTEISFFLGGNIYQQLDLKMEVGMCSEILMSLKMITESVINGVLTKTNLAQILVESLVQTKKNNSRHNLLKEFRKSMQVNWNEVAINRKYLRDKWIVQKKNERYYAQLMREEEENRKREEDETMRYIKRMEEEQNIERMKKEEMNEVLLKQFMQNDEK